ncbi:MAG: hypothetical protein ABIE68_01835 [bacterium]
MTGEQSSIQLQAQDVLVQPAKVSHTQAQTFTQDTGFEKLFLVSEFPKNENEASDNNTAQAVFKKFSDSLAERAHEAMNNRFEYALAAVNKLLTTRFENGSSDTLENIHVVIAVLTDNEIHFSATGRAKLILIRQDKMIEISKGMSDGLLNANKIFTNVISGVLASEDVMLLATPSLFQYFSDEKIKKTLRTYSPDLAAFNFQEMLESSDNEKPISAFIIHAKRSGQKQSLAISKNEGLSDRTANAPNLNIGSEEPKTESKKDEKITGSPLAVTAKKTQKLIKDSVFPALSRLGRKTAELSKKGIDKIKKPQGSDRQQKMSKRVYSTPPSFNQTSKASGNYARRKNPIALFFNRSLSNFRRLPTNSKLFIVGAMVIAIILIFSIMAFSGNSNENLSNEQATTILDSVKTKVSDAENAVIFKDEERALALFMEAQADIETILADDSKNEEALALQTTIADNISKLNKVNSLADPVVITQNHSNLNLSSLVNSEGTIYSYNTETNAVYALDRDGGQWLTSGSNASSAGKLKHAFARDNGTILFSTTDNEFYSFDSNAKTFSAVTIDYASGNNLVQDFSEYNSRLYVLDPQANEIFRYDRAGSGFGVGTEWIGDASVISGSVAFDIDGNIYILQGSGEVLNFLAGEQVELSLPPISPTLTAATRIQITESYIFVLDPVEKRVVVFTKEGKLANQYTSDRFGTLQDFIAIPSENTLIVMDENNSYSIPITDLSGTEEE